MELRPFDHGLQLEKEEEEEEEEEVEHMMMMSSFTSSYHIIGDGDIDINSLIESDAASTYNNDQLLELRYYTSYSPYIHYNCGKILRHSYKKCAIASNTIENLIIINYL